MSEKISQYSASVSALATGDLMDVSKLISTSPDVYQSQKLNYSVLISELNNDLTINNLGNANLTSTSAARTYSLYGNTSSDYLSFTDGTNTILKIKGDGYVGIGITTASAALNVYHATDAIVSKFQKGAVGNAVIQVLNSTTSTYYGLSTAGDDNGFSVGSSSDLLTNAYLRVLNSDGRLIHGLSSTAIADARLWNNSVNLYTDGSLLKARYKNNVGVASELTVGSNIANSNLTATAATRTYTLAGTAITDYLDITNGTDSVARFRGNKTLIFGNEITSYIKLDPYGVAAFGILQFCAAGTTTAYNVYDSTNAERFRVETSGMVYAKRGSLSSYMNYTTSINLWAEGTSSSFHFVGTNGSNHTVYIGNDSSHGYAEIKNSSGVTQSRISGSGDSYFLNNLAVGVASASARFHAKGSGNTSGTNTAIFQNSSSSASLTIKDDLTSTFGGVVTAPQIINTPSTVTVTANAGTVTRSYRNNNFTNSSAATMTITMSLTSALDGDMVMVRIFDFSAVAQTITWVNTENSSITVPATSNGSTTLPLTVGFQYNSATSKWRCIGSV